MDILPIAHDLRKGDVPFTGSEITLLVAEDPFATPGDKARAPEDSVPGVTEVDRCQEFVVDEGPVFVRCEVVDRCLVERLAGVDRRQLDRPAVSDDRSTRGIDDVPGS